MLGLFVSANEAKKVVDGWKDGHQSTRYWNYKPVRIAANAPLSMTVHDVDDDANIWWNGKFLYTHSRGDGPRKIKVTPRAGDNLFHFELTNHGAHSYSMYALLEQNGRRIAQLRLVGDDGSAAPKHMAFAPMTACDPASHDQIRSAPLWPANPRKTPPNARAAMATRLFPARSVAQAAQSPARPVMARRRRNARTAAARSR